MQLDLDIRKTLRSGQRVFHLDVRLQSSSQRIVILGPSGSGKSLTLKAIAGLLRPDSGHIRLDGKVLFDAAKGIHLPPQGREVAYVFQDYALFPHLTVRQNIAFGLTRGWFNPLAHVRHETVEYWLDAFQLAHLAHQFPAELSGGQRQRTALARALVARPRALLLDEPFAALDPTLRIAMREELGELQQRLQVPMVLITHDPEDAVVFGDHVLSLQDGRFAVEAGEGALEALPA
ncbi:MAG: ATP-binding cassette domain-containing protein [Thauera sp.]|jgi:molybdate transport system ATP-binding protein